MATLNKTNRLTLDAFSDPALAGPVYNRFTNRLKNPILNPKGVQIVNANMINCSLQLNDDNGQLMFWFFYGGTPATIRSLTNLRCVRLHPSWFIPYTGYTAYTKNAYFNTGTELATALNAAASTGGDSATYNVYWPGNNVISFAYDTASRRFNISCPGGSYIGLAAPDDPIVLDALRGTTNASNRIKMNGYNSVNTYASATLQPYTEGMTMNPRLGFPLKYGQRGAWFSAASGQDGIATATGVPFATADGAQVADTPPILLGVQNVGIYLNIAMGGGTDSQNRKHLIGSMPLENPPYAICSYTFCSVEIPALTAPTEIYELTIELIADNGSPYQVWSGTNTEIGLVLYY